MNPFELTKDPDGGGITVRVKHGFVVLTREEERRVTERITEILAENAKLRELAKKLKACNSSCGRCIELYGICEHETELQALGIEVSE